MNNSENKLHQIIQREKIAKLICAELNNFVDLNNSLITILKHIRSLTKCEAVGIRLHDKGDYPYYVYDGFPESFILKENSLCSKDKDGERVATPDKKGFLLDCMCGNIISGVFNPDLPFFTTNGSFWSNNTTSLLTNTTDQDRQARTRNYCNSCGYESVALIPIKAKNERIGLIQLNDKRVGMFNEELIEYMEMIGEHVGLAVNNSLIYTKLKYAYDEIETLRGIIPICSNCKKIHDDKGYWERVDTYISKHSEAKFSHGICPDCVKVLYPHMTNKNK